MFGGKRRFARLRSPRFHSRYEVYNCEVSITIGRAKGITGEVLILVVLLSSRRILSSTLALQVMPIIGGTSKPSREDVDR